MRFFFISILFIFLISVVSVVVLDSFTGAMEVTPNCGAERTYAFYRTLEEEKRAEAMWKQAGFVPTAWQEEYNTVDGTTSGYWCLRRLNNDELGQEHMWERNRVMTEGSSMY